MSSIWAEVPEFTHLTILYCETIKGGRVAGIPEKPCSTALPNSTAPPVAQDLGCIFSTIDFRYQTGRRRLRLTAVQRTSARLDHAKMCYQTYAIFCKWRFHPSCSSD